MYQHRTVVRAYLEHNSKNNNATCDNIYVYIYTYTSIVSTYVRRVTNQYLPCVVVEIIRIAGVVVVEQVVVDV
jgi:hypothetical protein